MKRKGCLILGYAASASGYILGIALAVRRMLSGASAAEILTSAAALFPSFSLTGILGLTGMTAITASAGLSATGTVFALPCAAVTTLLYGRLSAAVFAAFGIKGSLRLLWALPLITAVFLLTAGVSGDALRGSFFTMKRLGLIPEAKGQYADEGEGFSVQSYIRSSLAAVFIALVLTAYGHFAAGHIFAPS